MIGTTAPIWLPSSAFSHLALVNTAYNLTTEPDRPASHRAKDGAE